MAQLIEIQRVEVGLENLRARVRISSEAPLMTSEDLVGTTRIYNLMPHIIDHVCLGDAGDTFKDAMGHTELAHLLEHMTVELLSQSSASGEMSTGRTFPVEDDERCFDIELSCPDDVLVIGALSSAAWIAEWAYGGGGIPEPDVEAIVAGLTNMVHSLGDGPAASYQQQVENKLREEVEAEHQRLLAQREAEIAQREAEIEAARAKAQAEAEARAAAERAAAEERARARAEQEAAERAAQRPSWAVDVDDAGSSEEHRRLADQLAAERAALSAQEPVQEPGPTEDSSVETPENQTDGGGGEPQGGPGETSVSASVEDDAQEEDPAAELRSIFDSQPVVEPIQPAELEAIQESLPSAEETMVIPADDLGDEPVMDDGPNADAVDGQTPEVELPWDDPIDASDEAEALSGPDPEATDEDGDDELDQDPQAVREEHIPGPRRVR